MRVVSLIPSWTETLIESGAQVVGRTRFCIHPLAKVKSIPIVGGTKDLDFAKLSALKPDLLILDKEENLAWMQDQAPCPVHVTHVQRVQDMPQELVRLGQVLSCPPLTDLAERWQRVSRQPVQTWDWQKIPGQIRPLNRHDQEYKKLVYIIWKNPWMGISQQTFIGSVLGQLGAATYLPRFSQKYPQIELNQFNQQETFFLFSSEPFPFAGLADELTRQGYHGAIVDGESYSWFGLRTLIFLEQIRNETDPLECP